MSTTSEGRRGPGRRPGNGDTRGEILAAARAEFAAKGYDAASVRGIARSAGVDPALVHHYFGPKEQVFVAAMHLPFHPAERLTEVLAGDRDDLGERLARLFLGIWADPAFRSPMLAMLRSAMTGEQGAAMLREFVGSALLGRVAAALDLPEEARLPLTVAAAQMVGIVLLRHVVRVEPLASAPDEEIVALVAPTLQRYLDGPAPPPR
jgi:AcrR family transcriptional regulator